MLESRLDQASGLRRLLTPPEAGLLALTGAQPPRLAELTLALAGALARAGHPPLVLDLSGGALAQACGRASRYELMHVLDADRSLGQVLYQVPDGVTVLPAARALHALAGDWRGRERFAQWLAEASGSPRRILACVPAGSLEALGCLVGPPDTLLALHSASAEELTFAYGVVKRAHGWRSAARLLFEGLSAQAALDALMRLRQTALEYLGQAPQALGRLARSAAAGGALPCLDHDALARAALAWPLPALGQRSPLALPLSRRRARA